MMHTAVGAGAGKLALEYRTKESDMATEHDSTAVYDLASPSTEQTGPVYDLASKSSNEVTGNGAVYDLATPAEPSQTASLEIKHAWPEIDDSLVDGASHGYETISVGTMDRKPALMFGFFEEEA